MALEPVPESFECLEGLVTDVYLAQDVFGCALNTIYHWRKRRGLPYVKIPGHRMDVVRFRVEDVLAWAAEEGIQTYDHD